MKRRNRKTVHLFKNSNKNQTVDFYSHCSLIQYNQEEHKKLIFNTVDDITFYTDTNHISWLNIYGFSYQEAIRQITNQNKIDEFVINLTAESNHRNKVVELSTGFFFTLKSLYFVENNKDIQTEQLIFIVGEKYIWSIQEQKGDHFDHIRTRLQDNIGIARKKGVDYLFYLTIEAIIENYYIAYEKLKEYNEGLKDFNQVKPTPEFAQLVENNKNSLIQIKNASSSLKEAISQLEKLEIANFKSKYLVELKEQISFLNDDISFSIGQLESSINLIFSIQNHRLNEVMKTLTILSAIFIPLTFIAGIYGMNFNNMPELETKYGYFMLLSVMLILALIIIIYFRKKQWFK